MLRRQKHVLSKSTTPLRVHPRLKAIRIVIVMVGCVALTLVFLLSWSSTHSFNGGQRGKWEGRSIQQLGGIGLSRIDLGCFEKGGKNPHPQEISALLRKRPVLLKANFVLTKDRKRPYYRHFCGKYTGRGLVVKRPGVLSKVQMLTLVLGVGVFSLLPIVVIQARRNSLNVSNSLTKGMSAYVGSCMKQGLMF